MTTDSTVDGFQVVRGEPTEEELAAIVVVLRQFAREEAKKKQSRTEWNSPHRSMRRNFAYGQSMWRRSALPM